MLGFSDVQYYVQCQSCGNTGKISWSVFPPLFFKHLAVWICRAQKYVYLDGTIFFLHEALRGVQCKLWTRWMLLIVSITWWPLGSSPTSVCWAVCYRPWATTTQANKDLMLTTSIWLHLFQISPHAQISRKMGPDHLYIFSLYIFNNFGFEPDKMAVELWQHLCTVPV